MILRAIGGFVAAAVYQIITNPFVTAALIALIGWSIPSLFAALAYVSTYLLICAVAVTFRVRRKSRLPGLESATIETAPGWLFLFGDEQQGWLPDWLVAEWRKWVPRWWVAFSCCCWRNKLRNLPFLRCLKWLHKPTGTLRIKEAKLGSVTIIMRTRGWMTEIEYISAKRFGDFGPRLDQPDQWGGVSWAFRPFGRV